MRRQCQLSLEISGRPHGSPLLSFLVPSVIGARGWYQVDNVDQRISSHILEAAPWMSNDLFP